MKKHRLYFTFAIIISTLILQMPNIVHAQSPAISSGLTWLNSIQSTDGSWDSTTTATDSVQATSAVMESLAVLNSTASPNYVNASNWLTTQTFDTTRYLSDRLKILATSSADKNLILSYLDELSNAWGGYDDSTVNNLDTAFALQALKAANYTDTTVLYQAINFLTTNQNTDGGWGFISGKESNAYVTAIVLRALAAFSSTFSVQSSECCSAIPGRSSTACLESPAGKTSEKQPPGIRRSRHRGRIFLKADNQEINHLEI